MTPSRQATPQQELIELYRETNDEGKQMLFTLIALAARYGDQFIDAVKAEADAGGREALCAAVEHWKAKATNPRQGLFLQNHMS